MTQPLREEIPMVRNHMALVRPTIKPRRPQANASEQTPTAGGPR
jgi:hypothetical protein